MSRFDKIEMPRFTVEVHVPGFDIRKSIAAHSTDGGQ